MVASALEVAAYGIEESGVAGLGAYVPAWSLGRIDGRLAQRFAVAARELAEQIECGLWDHSLARCTADELLLHRCVDEAGWTWEMFHPDDPLDIEQARDEILQDEDVLLFWMPGAEDAYAAGAVDEVLFDGPSADPRRWFDRFTTTGRDRADP